MKLETLDKNIIKVKNATARLESRLAFFERNVSEVESDTERLRGPFSELWEGSIEASRLFIKKHGEYMKKHIALENALIGLLNDMKRDESKGISVSDSIAVFKEQYEVCLSVHKTILQEIDKQIKELKEYNQMILGM